MEERPSPHVVHGEPELVALEEVAPKKDHPIWGIITAVIVCVTLLIAIQMLTNYHW